MTTKTTIADVLTSWLIYELQSEGYRYDRSIARYRNRATGRIVAEKSVFEAADGFREHTQANMGKIAERYNSGKITASQFRAQMRQEIKDSHIVNHSAGRGGRNAMTQSDWGRVGGRLRNEFRHLDTFVDELSGLSEAQIEARAKAYGTGAPQKSYNDGMTEAHVEAELSLMFELGNTEKHCSSCLGLSGVIKTAEEWRNSELKPQSSALECGGFACDCRLTPVKVEDDQE